MRVLAWGHTSKPCAARAPCHTPYEKPVWYQDCFPFREFGWGISSSILVVLLLCAAANPLTILAIALLSACLRDAAQLVAGSAALQKCLCWVRCALICQGKAFGPCWGWVQGALQVASHEGDSRANTWPKAICRAFKLHIINSCLL